MTDREAIESNVNAYLIMGDVDKPFHRPECECEQCENWRIAKDRPTHKELREKQRARSQQTATDGESSSTTEARESP